MKKAKKAFRATIFHTLGPDQLLTFEDGLLSLDEQGKVVDCDHYQRGLSQLPSDCQVVDFSGSYLFPGFVDTHVHLPQLDCRNKHGYTLLDWLEKFVYPTESSFADLKVAGELAPRFFDALIKHGITTAAVYCTVHAQATDLAFEIAKEKGLRIIMGQVLMDQNAPDALLRQKNKLLNQTENLIAKWHGKNERLFYAVTPRFALTCSKDLLVEAGKLCSNGVYFQTHMAETVDEVSRAKELYHFENYSGFYQDCGCLSSHSLLAHAIYLADNEWKILSETNSAIAHCPTSNVFLKSGTMPLSKVEEYGLRCGFGTDVGAGPTFSMGELAACAKKVHTAESMNLAKALYMATLGGAKALSMDNVIGNFELGKSGDFSIFENEHYLGEAKATFIAGEQI